jgi:glycosyltransferase involved in cell wall biosynthesis
VVVVDASPDWEEHRSKLLETVGKTQPGIHWKYVEATTRSLPAQRNQAIKLATSDILFMIDDDSLMYPDCSAEVMKIYEADRGREIVGLAPIEVHEAPDEQKSQNGTKSKQTGNGGLRSFLVNLMERQLDVERLLLPYDAKYPDRPVSKELKSLGAVPVRYLHGFTMTYRRETIAKEGFEEILLRYAAAEDMDASYRVSRHGAIAFAVHARLFHARDSSGRLTRFTRQALGMMNLAVLYRLKGHNPRLMYRSFRWRLIRRLPIDLLRDLARRRFNIPNVRANLYALRRLDHVLKLSEDELRQWYPKFQVDLIDANPQ